MNPIPDNLPAFKGQLPHEQVLSFFRYHWIKIIDNIFVAFFLSLLLIASLIFGVPILQNLEMSPLFVMILYTLLGFVVQYQFIRILNYHLCTVILTDSRLVQVDKSVFFKDSRTSTDLSKIQDVLKKQNGILPSIFDFGELTVTMSGGERSIQLKMVPRPDLHFKRINLAKQNIHTALLASTPS